MPMLRKLDSHSDETDRRLARDAVAIVGMSGRFPKAGDVQEFWANIVSGRDCSDEVPQGWWSPERYFDADPFAEDKTYCRRGGFLTPELFDPGEFGIPPKVVDSTGLVQLLSLVVAKEALLDAGRGREQWHNPVRTGVVLGVCGTNSTLIPLAARLLVPEMDEAMEAFGVSADLRRKIINARLASLPPWREDSFPGILGNVVSGRVANRLNLKAANHTVDAACASSLTAVRSAIDELVGRRADVMLTGGCDADNSIVSFMCFTKTPALSLTGQVRPFDADADGTLIGEGVGIVVLKRLEDAERDGDHIYAVVRGLGSSSDGSAKSIYAPCGEGQLAALRKAYEDADCDPRSVELIEAHGTGTPAGDEVELSALNTLLATPDDHHYAAVGSVKSQIGHTKAAAGVAGLIKAALALHHKVLPPTINVRNPSAQAARENGAVYVNTTARPWVLDPVRRVRRAGVSAFGFGGVNYHAVLEEYAGEAGTPSYAPHGTARANVWHAPDAVELLRRLEAGGDAAEDRPPAAHARIGFVAAGPEEYEELLACAVKQLRAKIDQDSWSHPRGVHYRRTALPPETKVGALFAGQGSQYVNMGRHAAMALTPVRSAFDAANALFPPSDTLARTVFPAPNTADEAVQEARLRRTSYAQSAIGALSAGQYWCLRELGFAPHGFLGHSFGELTALWAAGVLDDESFPVLARERGRAMELPADDGGDPGVMAAANLPDEVLREALAVHVDLAVCSRNAPDEYTLGGPSAIVGAFVEWCTSRGVRAHRLDVAGAFHTEHVAHAAGAFETACSAVAFAAPAGQVYADTAGAAYTGDAAADRRTLAEQLRSPMDFAARLEEMYADGIRVFVEFGPGRTLSPMVERTLGKDSVEVIACDAGPDADSAAALLRAAVRLTVLGLPLSDLNRWAPPARRPRTAAPSKVARTLEGPLFAMEGMRPGYDKALAEHRAALQGTVALPQQPAPPAVVVQEADPLTRAAAEHLAAHSRYLDGQVRTADELTRLLKEGASAGPLESSFVEVVNAVTEHSLAIGRVHAKAAQAVTDLLGRPNTDQPWSDVGQPLGRPTAVEAFPATGPAAGGTAMDPDPGLPDGSIPHPSGPPPAESDDEVGERAQTSALAQLWAKHQQGEDIVDLAMMDVAEVDLVEVERVLRAVVAEKTGYDIDMIEPDMYIQEDLGIDSLKQVEIGAEMWRRYPVIKRSDLFTLSRAKTVRELEKLFYEVITNPSSQLHVGPQAATPGRAFVTLRELPPVDVCGDAFAEQPQALLLDDGGALSAAVAKALDRRGWRVGRLLLPGASDPESGEVGFQVGKLTDWDEPGLAACVAGIAAEEPNHLDLFVLPFSRTGTEESSQVIGRLRHAVLAAKQVVPLLEAGAKTGGRTAFVTATQLDGALGYAGSGGAPEPAWAGGLGGLVKTLALEAPMVFCRALDFAPELDPEVVAEAFVHEITDMATDVYEVGIDRAGRRTPVLTDTPAELLPSHGDLAGFTEDDFILVTGGAAGITSWCVEALAAADRCGFLLMGRTRLEEEPGWAAALADDELRVALEERARTAGEDPRTAEVRTRIDLQSRGLGQQREIRRCLDELRSHGVEAHYAAADVRDAQAVAAALEPYADRITGVIHGAGLLKDRLLAEATVECVAAVVDTKLAGLQHVLAALDPARLRHLVLFSSVAGIFGNLRQGDYALANEGLNRFACAFQVANPGCRVVPIAWGPWTGGMAATVQQVFTDAGIPVLAREEGCTHFLDRMATAAEAGAVCVIGPCAPLYQRTDPLPPAGRTAHRMLTGLEGEPVLRDHRFDGVPVLPMTGAVGWALNTVERTHGGALRVVGCDDFRIAHGVFFPGGHPERFRVRLVKSDISPAAVAVSIDDDTDQPKPRYSGRFRLAAQAPDAPTVELPGFTVEDRLHPGYTDGTFFHGPSLRGLRNVLVEETHRLVVAARMPDPGLAKGAFAGRLYNPALSDLVLQAVVLAFLRRERAGCLPVPVSIGRLELFTPLPDDEPFAVVVESQDDPSAAGSLFSRCTLTACAPDGRVHQRWTDTRLLWVEPSNVVGTIRD